MPAEQPSVALRGALMQSTITDFHSTYAQLRDRLSDGPELPGFAAHKSFAPEVRADDPSLLSVEGRACREAGVLAILYPEANGVATVLLTLRRADLKQHGGQVSFPGGRVEPGETRQEAAVRETHEEVGISPGELEVVGALSPLYVYVSRFCIYPYLAVCRETPEARPEDTEVAAVIAAPVASLVAPDARKITRRTIRGVEMTIPYFDIAGHVVWGATAMMLAELAALLKGAQK